HRDELSGEAQVRRKTGDVVAGAVDELLEHHPVVALFDRLVVGVTELGGAVRKLERIRVQASLEDVLELHPDLRRVREAIHADPGANLLRLRAIPRMPAE